MSLPFAILFAIIYVLVMGAIFTTLIRIALWLLRGVITWTTHVVDEAHHDRD